MMNHSLFPQSGLRMGRCVAAGYPPAYCLRVEGQMMRVREARDIVPHPNPNPLPLAGEGTNEENK
ncbi:hypothetical protein Slit_1628 [Sideroxydans lithotrophicus ES-1]|uniref:Uncharacterized protein n=1 Tax=Sideroxydans lithotrophicus (strain ES-1) TaxID=580332 RepID=D5CSC5_SIDLE|nr:hypothetical protein Slit_1628 [Sideroxydans lithotrophicus ES-1]